MRALVLFAAAVAVFHHAPALAGGAGDWVDLVTPFAVAGAAAAVLVGLDARAAALGLALVAGIAYVDGHGIHLAANSIAREPLAGEAADVAHFWDEELGHIEWHLGLFGLLAAFCLAERRGAGDGDVRWGAAAALLLGFTLFTSTVEGQTWWLLPPAVAGLGAWTLLRPGPVRRACAAGVGAAGLLLAAWAAWHGGVPEFSDLGWI